MSRIHRLAQANLYKRRAIAGLSMLTTALLAATAAAPSASVAAKADDTQSWLAYTGTEKRGVADPVAAKAENGR